MIGGDDLRAAIYETLCNTHGDGMATENLSEIAGKIIRIVQRDFDAGKLGTPAIGMIEVAKRAGDLTFNEYAAAAATTVHNTPRDAMSPLAYDSLALAGEAGEVAIAALAYIGFAAKLGNVVKKVYRDDNSELREERKAAIIGELGGALWYWFDLCRVLGISGEDIARQNLIEIGRREMAGKIRGDGDKRG